MTIGKIRILGKKLYDYRKNPNFRKKINKKLICL